MEKLISLQTTLKKREALLMNGTLPHYQDEPLTRSTSRKYAFLCLKSVVFFTVRFEVA